ncbi:MAG: FAD:protein FMN transferase [gamma proteobacterium symbiont of Bathyaustriella thionipta]|nr:FAD:protein FMN transferase [gamma proteobacterium symbiont of Bathyaustriella thionipta]
MALSRRAFLTTGITLGAAIAVGLLPKSTRLQRSQWYQFGTLVDVSLSEDDSGHAKDVLSRLAAALQRMNNDWHPWKPGMMGDINQALASGHGIAVNNDIQQMIGQIRTLFRDSGGAFNPTIGNMIGAWGFHGTPDVGWKPLDDLSIAALREQIPSPDDLKLQQGVLSSRNRQAALDLGGYAKGFALNRARELLLDAGIQHALINAGGDLAVIGDAGGRPWRIAVRHPQRKGAVAWLNVGGKEAVATSGDYERFHQYAGRRYAHIIDPRSAKPVSNMASATVVHPDAAFADAAATALIVAGPTQWREVATAMGVETAMVIDEQGRLSMTPDMQLRLHLSAA